MVEKRRRLTLSQSTLDPASGVESAPLRVLGTLRSWKRGVGGAASEYAQVLVAIVEQAILRASERSSTDRVADCR